MRISDWSSDVCSSDLPFVKSDNTLGPVLVYVNDEEKPGAIRISADAEPGRPLDPFHAAIAGTYKLCAGSGSGAAPPATPEPSPAAGTPRSEEHTSELQSLMRISYAVFCLKKKTK